MRLAQCAARTATMIAWLAAAGAAHATITACVCRDCADLHQSGFCVTGTVQAVVLAVMA